MSAASASLTDEVIREIGEQISQVIVNRTKFGKTRALDLKSGIALYENHIQTASSLQKIRRTQDGEKNMSRTQISGKSFEVLDVHDRRSSKKKAYTTDELADLREEGGEEWSALVARFPELKDLAQHDHEKTDVVELGPKGYIRTYQHKAYDKPTQYFKEFEEDIENDKFVVPVDKYDAVLKDLNRRIKKGGEEGKKARKIKKGLEKSSITFNEAKNPRRTQLMKGTKDAGTRISKNVGIGVVSDLAVFTFGGVVMEVRGAYQNPHEMPLMERCKRFLQAVLEKLQTSLKDRSLREIGSEVILGVTTALIGPIKRAGNAIKKAVDVLRRLWMDFVSGKIKSLAEVISASLKAIFAVASVGIALSLEQWLSSMMVAIPGGDILAAIIAAALAGIMIVIASRSIEAVVQTLFGIFGKGAAARLRREEIQRRCDEIIPQLIEDRNRLEDLMRTHFAERDKILRSSFAQLKANRDLHNMDGFLKGLVKINAAYGSSLPWWNSEQFDQRMLDDKPMQF